MSQILNGFQRGVIMLNEVILCRRNQVVISADTGLYESALTLKWSRNKNNTKRYKGTSGAVEAGMWTGKAATVLFSDLVPLQRRLPDPSNQSYTTYPGVVHLMNGILSSTEFVMNSGVYFLYEDMNELLYEIELWYY